MNSLVHGLRGSLPRIAFPATPRQARQILGFIGRQASIHRRALAVAGSVALHLLLILALLFPLSPNGLSGGGSGGIASGAGTGETYAAVDLIPAVPAPAATSAVRPPNDSQAEALDSPPDAIKPQADALKTADAVAQLATTEAAATTGGAGQAGTTSGRGDDLWAAIAPCWKRIAGRDALPVRLTVSFANNGLLERAPEIVRDPLAPIDVHTQLSEAQAIQALSECGAYTMAAGRENVTINFPRP